MHKLDLKYISNFEKFERKHPQKTHSEKMPVRSLSFMNVLKKYLRGTVDIRSILKVNEKKGFFTSKDYINIVKNISMYRTIDSLLM